MAKNSKRECEFDRRPWKHYIVAKRVFRDEFHECCPGFSEKKLNARICWKKNAEPWWRRPTPKRIE